MPGHAADRNLLFGILALQMDLITRDALVAAMGAWALAKDRTIGEILVEAGAMDPVDRLDLEPMVDRRVEREGGDPARSLASLSSAASLATLIRRSVTDPEVLGSLAYVTRDVATDTLATRADDPAGGPAGPTAFVPHGVRYRKVRDHAEGGLGVVFVARDEELNREVALKEIKPRYADNPSSQARFLMEAEITGGLEHPGIVPVYGLGSYEDGRPFYAMRFIKGDSLKDAIAAFHADGRLKADPGERALALQKLLRRFLDVCNAVAYAHSRGVLHRDLKPDNVMVGKYGETLVVDWGLAKAGGLSGGGVEATTAEATLNPASASGSEETLPGSVIGTPAYMSPEQAEGRLDRLGPASDVYSLGATLYALLVGSPPFGGKPVTDTLADVRAGRFARPRERTRWLDPALEAICLKAMAVRPEGRYPSPRELAGDVESWLADEPVSAWPEPWARRLARWSRRHRSGLQAASALVVAASAIGLAAWSVHRSNRLDRARRSIAAGVAVEDWSPGHLEAMDRQGRDLGRLDPVEGAEARHQAHRRYARLLGEAINRPETLSAADVERIGEGLRALEAKEPDLALPLRENLALRLSRWSTLFDLAAPARPEAVDAVFRPGRARAAPGGRIERTPPAEGPTGPVVATRVAGSGRVRLTATFAESWEASPAVGLVHDFGEKGRYLFLVGARELTPDDLEHPGKAPAMESGRAGSGRLTVQVFRDRSLLGRSTIPIPVGPLRLEAEHDGSGLSLQVNGQAPLVAEDPFPILVESGELGVYWPLGVALNRLTAERLALPSRPSPLERGDELYRGGRFAEALSFYREQAAGRPDGEAGAQARFKQALCLIEVGKPDEAAELLRGVAEGLESASTEGRAAPRWPLRAACRLWLLEVQRKRFAEADRVLDRLAPSYRFEQLVTLIPANDRRAILDTYRLSGAWWRVLWLTNAEDLRRLRRAASAQQLLEDDPRQRRMTLWRVVDVERGLGEDEAAARDLAALLADPDLPADERVAFAVDHAWMAIGRGEAATRRALLDVDAWLDRSPRPPGLAPLLLERSRLLAALGRWDEARRACEEFFAAAPLDRLEYATFADACLLRGFLREEQGDHAGAVEAWKAGLLRNRPGGLAPVARGTLLSGIAMRNRSEAVTSSSMLGSLTGELTEAEVAAILEALSTGTGLEDAEGQAVPGAVVPFVGKLALPLGYLRSVVLGEFGDDRGRAMARAMTFRRAGFKEIAPGPISLLVASAIRLNEPGGVLADPGLDPLIWGFARGLVDAYPKQAIDDSHVMIILRLWFGLSLNPPGLVRQFLPQLPAELRETATYVIARRYQAMGRRQDASSMFRMVLERSGPETLLHRIARGELAAANR